MAEPKKTADKIATGWKNICNHQTHKKKLNKFKVKFLIKVFQPIILSSLALCWLDWILSLLNRVNSMFVCVSLLCAMCIRLPEAQRLSVSKSARVAFTSSALPPSSPSPLWSSVLTFSKCCWCHFRTIAAASTMSLDALLISRRTVHQPRVNCLSIFIKKIMKQTFETLPSLRRRRFIQDSATRRTHTERERVGQPALEWLIADPPKDFKRYMDCHRDLLPVWNCMPVMVWHCEFATKMVDCCVPGGGGLGHGHNGQLWLVPNSFQ